MPLRHAWLVAIAALSCGRDRGVSDEQLGNLVLAPRPPAPIRLDEAVASPGELSRALALPHAAVLAAIGPHALTIDGRTVVAQGGKQTDELTEHVTLETGAKGAFHGVYTNSADYGREAIYTGGTLYLRPRYQKWNGRAPETESEPDTIRDNYFSAVAATWDLVAPGAELSDQGATQIAGRAGRKIAIKLAASPRENPEETLTQRHWRQTRAIRALSGEVVLDAEHGVPLAAKLTGAVEFSREGKRFVMTVSIDAKVTKVGATAIAAPAADEVVAAPTRLGEVDERDYLLHGIAPPIHKTADGTAREATPPHPPTSPTPDRASPDKPKSAP